MASPDLDAFAPERFPIWIRLGSPCFYGFPVYGERAVKIAQDLGGPEVEPDDEESVVDPARVDARARVPGAPPAGRRRPGRATAARASTT